MATTVEDLARGDGWTPARFKMLRELAGDHVLPRFRFRKDLAAAIGVTERSWFRWEHGQTMADEPRRRMIGNWALENLPPAVFETIAAAEDEPVPA